MVNAIGGGSKPAPVKKPEEKKEEKKPESQAPAPSPAPSEKPNTGNTGSANKDVPKDGLDPKAAFEVSQRLNTKSAGGDGKSGKGDESGDKTSKKEAVEAVRTVADIDEVGTTMEGEAGSQKDAADAVGDIAGNGEEFGADKKTGADKESGTDKKSGSNKEADGADKKSGTEKKSGSSKESDGADKKSGADKKAGNDEKDTKASEKTARDLLEGIGGTPDKKDPKADGKDGDSAGKGDSATGKSEPGTKAGKGDDKKGEEKPKEKPITKDSALQYVHKNYEIFDTGAGIGDRDNKFSMKDLNKLKDSNVKEISDNAQMLIDEGVIDEFGGKDGKISLEDLENNALSEFEVEDGVILKTKGMSADQIQKTKKDIQFLSEDEDGSKLIKASTEDGPITISYDPSYKDGLGGTYSAKEIKLSKSALDDKKGGIGTLTHEFVHAATDHPDHDHAHDSKSEETIASVLGDRVKGRFNGKEADEQATYDHWMDWTHEAESYKGLDFDNEIIEELEDIGITFDLDLRTK